MTEPASPAHVISELRRTLARQARQIERLEAERDALHAQMQTRAEELEIATRMLRARERTMTSVIDAVTEQSIIGTDRDGVIRVWNPGAERMLGLPRAAVVRRRSIVDFHVPDELDAAGAAGGGGGPAAGGAGGGGGGPGGGSPAGGRG